jgi:lysophospholipase L1-like esterase
VSIGGKQLRLRFSNTFGTGPAAIVSAHVALSAWFGSAGNGDISTNSDKALTFQGMPSVNISPGEAVLSDPLNYDLPALTNLAVSIYFGAIPAGNITGHPGSRTTSFILPGDAVSAPALTGAAKAAHWYFITGAEVLADAPGKTVVTLGDSLTDGRGSTTDGDNRWPDVLAQRLNANPPTSQVAVVNMGIGGNGIFGGLGPAAVSRFDRDVLNQNGARWVIIFEGVNDIGGASGGGSPALATNLIAAYKQFIAKAHARNLRAYGATITPFGGHSYHTPAREAARQTINTWIRTSHLYDATIDFDAVVRDPVTLTNLQSSYDSGDHLHLNPAGYQAMSDAIDLTLFTK